MVSRNPDTASGVPAGESWRKGLVGRRYSGEEVNPPNNSEYNHAYSLRKLRAEMASTPGEQRETFQILEATKQAAVETIMHHYLILRPLNSGDERQDLEPWQRAFLDDFNALYPHAQHGIPGDIVKCAENYITNEYALLMAVKMMEWEQVTLMRSTSAEIDVIRETKRERHVEEVRSAHGVQGGRRATGGDKGRRWLFQAPQNAAINREERERLRQQGEDWSALYKVKVNGARYVPPDDLTAGQRAFLNDLTYGNIPPEGHSLNADSQKRLAHRLQDIIGARTNFYEVAAGYQLNKQDMIMVSGGREIQPSGHVAFIIGDSLTNQNMSIGVGGGIERRGGPVDNLDAQLDLITRAMGDETAKLLDRQRVQGTLHKLKAQQDNLRVRLVTAKEARVAAEERVSQIEDLRQAKQGFEHEVKKRAQEIVKKRQERQRLDAQLWAITGGSFDQVNYDALVGSILAITDEIQKLGRTKEYNGEQIATLQQQQSADQAIVSNPSVGKDMIKQARQDMAQTSSEIRRLQEENKNVDDQITHQNSLLAKAKEQKELWEKVRECAQQIQSTRRELIGELQQHETNLDNNATFGQIDVAITSVQSNFDDRIGVLEQRIKHMQQGDEVFVLEHRIRTMESLASCMAPATYEEIMNRAMQRYWNRTFDRSGSTDGSQEDANGTVAEEVELARSAYPALPPAYLRAMHVLFGTDVTDPVPASRQKMKRAMDVLPPDTFLRMFKECYSTDPQVQALDGISDGDLMNEPPPYVFMGMVDAEFISYVFAEFSRQIQADTFGVIDSSVQNRWSELATVEPADMTQVRSHLDRNVEVSRESCVDYASLVRQAGNYTWFDDDAARLQTIQQVRSLQTQGNTRVDAIKEVTNQYNQANKTEIASLVDNVYEARPLPILDWIREAVSAVPDRNAHQRLYVAGLIAVLQPTDGSIFRGMVQAIQEEQDIAQFISTLPGGNARVDLLRVHDAYRNPSSGFAPAVSMRDELAAVIGQRGIDQSIANFQAEMIMRYAVEVDNRLVLQDYIRNLATDVVYYVSIEHLTAQIEDMVVGDPAMRYAFGVWLGLSNPAGIDVRGIRQVAKMLAGHVDAIRNAQQVMSA